VRVWSNTTSKKPYGLGVPRYCRPPDREAPGFFGALQIDGFIDKDEFKKQIDDWIHVFRNTKPAPGTIGPLLPGDPEREAEAIRSKRKSL
jgi:LDH2 family malate/lactate/ureidoglycolate dehydrogenase